MSSEAAGHIGKGAESTVITAGTTMAAALVLVLLQDVVLAGLDGRGAEDGGEFMMAGVALCPLLDGVEHVALDLNVVVSDGWVVECAEDVVDDFVNGDAGVFPSIENATE